MLTQEQIQMIAKLMNQNPGLSEQDALQAVLGMPPGAFVNEGANGRMDAPLRSRSMAPQGPAFGSVAGDNPQVGTGVLTPQGMQPRPQPQGGMSPSACAQMGGSVQGGACVIPMMGQR